MNPTSRLEKLKKFLENNHQPKFRFEQLKKAILDNSTISYSQISTLPKSLKELISSEFGDQILSLSVKTVAQGDQAHKILFETADHKLLEAVRLTYYLKNPKTGIRKLHHALCVSSQAGCALGCTFCATGKMGMSKNLTVDEIVDQYLYFCKQNLPIDSIIFMGMGEPMSNPLNVFAALSEFTDASKIGLSQRRISVSTVGIIPGIERLTNEYPNINLAFSLHSPFPEERLSLMPVTKAYPIDQVFGCLDKRLAQINHKIFIAYVLLAGVNDTPDHANVLAKIITSKPNRKKLMHINLIRYNPGDNKSQYQRPTKKTVDEFMKILEAQGVKVTLRQDFGVRINAACGQLAAANQ